MVSLMEIVSRLEAKKNKKQALMYRIVTFVYHYHLTKESKINFNSSSKQRLRVFLNIGT